MQEVRKSQNQDLRAEPGWIINSGKIVSRLGDFSGPEVGSEHFWPKRARDTVSHICWDLP